MNRSAASENRSPEAVWRRWIWRKWKALAVALLAETAASAATAAICTFAQPGAFTIGEASTSSRLAVSGVVGPVTNAVVVLTDVGAPGGAGGGISDLDLLLASPTGQKIVLVSYACPFDYVLFDLTFDKTASSELPDGDPESADCSSGTYLPTDHSALVFGYLLAAPAPMPPYSKNLATLEAVDPTGMWKLWGAASEAANQGQVASWELRLTATSCGTPTLVFADDFESGVCGWSGESGESPACP